MATVPSTKPSKGKSTEARHSKKSNSKSRSNHSKSKVENPKKMMRQSSSIFMMETGDLGIMPPTTIQDDEASKDLSDISNMSENIVMEKPPKLSDEKADGETQQRQTESKVRQSEAASVKASQKARPSVAASEKSTQKPTFAKPPSQTNKKTPEQAVPHFKVQPPQQKRGLFSVLRCCTTNDAVVAQPTTS